MSPGLRIAIVEDEAVVARRLERMVRELVTGAEVALAPTLAAAQQLVRDHRVDVLLLDLNLRGRDGFELLAEATAASYQTIVVSAHHDQALRAFEYGVVDFVAKPWTSERLRQAFDRAAGRQATGQAGARYLVVRAGRELRAVPVDQVVFVRGADDYAELHLDGGVVHLHEKTLAALALILPKTFVRLHRSYLVDLARVRALRPAAGGRLMVLLADGRALPVGRVYRAALRERLAR